MSETPVDQQALPGDGLREGIVDELRRRLGEALVDHELRPNDDLWVRVATDSWAAAGAAVRAMGFSYFCFLSGLDWLPSPYGRGEDNPDEPPPERSTEVVQGVTGGATRFQVFARVVDPVRHVGVTLKTDVPDEAPVVATWSSIYAGANWHERETHEMFGIDFAGHPDLRHLYLPGEFEGHPLRKDFPLLARMVKPWPGIVDVEPMPSEDRDGDGVADTDAAEANATTVDPSPGAVDTAPADEVVADDAARSEPEAAVADEAGGTAEVPVGEVSSQAGAAAGADAAIEAAETSPDEAPAPQSTDEAEATERAGADAAPIDETEHASATVPVASEEAEAEPGADEATAEAPVDQPAADDAEADTAAGAADTDADAGEDREIGTDAPPTEADAAEPGAPWSPDIPVADVEGPYGLGSKAPRPDGAQPPDHPIKADPATRHFFVPGSEGYDDLEPGVWFDSETTARQAGFRSPFDADLGGQGAVSGPEAAQMDDRHDSRPDGPAQEGGEG